MASVKGSVRNFIQMVLILLERENAWKELDSFMPVLRGVKLQLECIMRDFAVNSHITSSDVARFMVAVEVMHEQGLDQAIEATSTAPGIDIGAVHCNLLLIQLRAHEFENVMENSFQHMSLFLEQYPKEIVRRIQAIECFVMQSKAQLN